VGAVLAVVLIVYFVVVRPNKPSPTGSLTGTERAAMAAAGTDVANLSSYRRASFAADYARALAGVTGALKTDVTAEKAATQKALTAGKFDLSATATQTALVGPAEKGSKDSFVVLVVLNGFRSTQKDIPIPQNLEVTVVRTKVGSTYRWLANDVTNVAIS
jgi:hypothetical protein